MYSGLTFTKFSGRLIGAHQKIDRLARRQLEHLLPHVRFPGARSILHFEGKHGPDGIKRKSPAKDEPWHYLQPFDLSDTQLIELIEDHYAKLVKALRAKDGVRASFEAAWLSHAIVDGLTPAHHYPYEEKLVELSAGRAIEERTSPAKKVFVQADTKPQTVANNWKVWGPKGLFVTHAAFEWGVAILMAPMKLKRRTRVTSDKLHAFDAQGLAAWFRAQAQDIARLGLYDNFYESGWTIPLARQVRRQLAPRLVQAVTVVWYAAAREAGVA